MNDAAAPPVNDDEAALWWSLRQEGAVGAREALFTAYMPYARSIALRCYRERSHGDLDLADLRQLGFAGLLEAIDRFDPGQQVPFRAYAGHRIRGSIADGLARMSERREQLNWQQRLRRERIRSLASEGAEPGGTNQPLARLAEIAVGLAIGFMLEGSGMVLADETSANPSAQPGRSAYDGAAWRQLLGRLSAELGSLPDDERMIVRRHYIDGMPFEQIATLANLSRARISQIHRAALGRLRKRLAARGHFRLEQ